VFELIPGTFRLSSGKSVPLFRLSAKDVRVLSVEVSVRETGRGVDIVEKVEMSYRALGMAVSYPSDSDVTASREDCQVTSAEES
jgi:type VI protein secretion system component Hcp